MVSERGQAKKRVYVEENNAEGVWNDRMGEGREREKQTAQKGVIITFGMTFSFFPSFLLSPLFL